MKRIIAFHIVLLFLTGLLSGQTRTEIEEQRKKNLEEIAYVDNLLTSTSKEKSASLNALKDAWE
ncbi:MAG: hypothetical protein MZV63_29410 [Marinilabiliales bacterium]|nr:hypothetical protein [Marinilabiliales bacterium]